MQLSTPNGLEERNLKDQFQSSVTNASKASNKQKMDQSIKEASGQTATSGKEINIDINGEPDSTAIKTLSPDESPRVGLTKEELMKYANEPFWVRLRNILFAVFWIVWVAILVAAVGYVINSPKCKMVSAAAANGTLASDSTSSG